MTLESTLKYGLLLAHEPSGAWQSVSFTYLPTTGHACPVHVTKFLPPKQQCLYSGPLPSFFHSLTVKQPVHNKSVWLMASLTAEGGQLWMCTDTFWDIVALFTLIQVCLRSCFSGMLSCLPPSVSPSFCWTIICAAQPKTTSAWFSAIQHTVSDGTIDLSVTEKQSSSRS